MTRPEDAHTLMAPAHAEAAKKIGTDHLWGGLGENLCAVLCKDMGGVREK